MQLFSSASLRQAKASLLFFLDASQLYIEYIFFYCLICQLLI